MNQFSIDVFLSKKGWLVDVPEKAIEYPSMTTMHEKQLLYRLARNFYEGKGLIIDAGLFLGASTNAMGWGIRDNADLLHKVRDLGVKPIQSYDIALWHTGGFNKYLDRPLVRQALGGHTFENGDNYDFLLRKLLAEHSELVEFHFGDIVKKAHVPDGKMIEIAFYDCLKNYERDWAAFKAFGPHYVPRKTILVQQDYFYEEALDNKLRQEFLSPYFEYLGMANTSAIFQLVKPLPAEYFESDPLLTLSVDDGIDLLESASARANISVFKIYAEVGVVRYMIKKNKFDLANMRLTEIERTVSSLKLPPRPAVIIKQARDFLDQKRG
jgi:hypothetical protein